MSLVLQYFSMLTLTSAMLGSLPLSAQDESVNIGLLVPDRSFTEVIQAAELAIGQANLRPGMNSKHFELVVRTTVGPWGAGSKESVNLVYEDKVMAILGSLDGRNAHLAEQVATKSHITYLETRATDPTLSQAFVPWFFRCIPNDDQQSEAILELIQEKGGGRMAVLSTGEYDPRMAAKSLTRISARRGYASPKIFMIDPDLSHIEPLIVQITNMNIRHLVVTVHSMATLEIIGRLKRSNPEMLVYGTHSFTAGMDHKNSDCNSYEGMMMISDGNQFTATGTEFRNAFRNKYGYLPGVSASCAYDGMNLILVSILNTGTDREAIKDYLSEIQFKDGATGSISFDEFGNRTGKFGFIQILDGKPVLLD